MTGGAHGFHATYLPVVRYAGRGEVGPLAHNSHPDVVLIVVLVVVATVIEQAQDQRSGKDAIPREGGEAEFQRQQQNATMLATKI
jgi:hypothetical protein